MDRRFGQFALSAPFVGLIATVQTLNLLESPESAEGVLVSFLMWHAFQVLPLMLWAVDRAGAAPRLPRAETEISKGIWVRSASSEEGTGDIVIAIDVRVEGVRSVETVIKALVDCRGLPAIPGGRRRWSLTVDEVPVGSLTQTWLHPRWWPEIEWETSASGVFKGKRIEFRLVER